MVSSPCLSTNYVKANTVVLLLYNSMPGYAILILPTTGRYFQVPYGICVPIGVDNLLVGGRCVAGDRTSHAAMRNMMACCVTGSGCGAAAAVSISTGTSTQNVDVKKVQQELQRQGTKVF